MKILCYLFVMLLSLSGFGASAEDIRFDTPITLTVNDTFIKSDTEPFLHEGTTYVPIRFVSLALGAESVTWDAEQGKASISCEGKTIAFYTNKKGAYVNGVYTPVAGGIKLVGDRIYVPVRFVAETFGCTVDWIYASYTVNISKEGVSVPEELVGSRSYTDDETYWLSKIIHAESRGEPMHGKIGVGNTILNRVESREYPNTIYGVIFDRNHGVQFSPVSDGSIYQTPHGDSIVAAKRALRGENVVGESLFFLNPRKASNHWIIKNRAFYKTIANHDFYL